VRLKHRFATLLGHRQAGLDASALAPTVQPTSDSRADDPGDPGPAVQPPWEAPAGGHGPGAASAAGGEDPCGPARAAVTDACSLADRMAALSLASLERLQAARRAYDGHADRRERAAAAADPRAVRAAKDEAHATFRRARLAVTDRAALEASAREWLREVDRINARTRDAMRLLAREDAAEAELALELDRLGVEADGARIAAESAAEACRNARITLATCEERERAGTVQPVTTLAPATMVARATTAPVAADPASAPDAGSAADERDVPEPAGPAAPGPAAPGGAGEPGEPAILPLLAGDRAVLRRLAAELAQGDAVAVAGWELHLAALVDAITRRAIDSAALIFPEDHAFWGEYTQLQCREITAALAALGYRYDGNGGFADGRIPSQRELSLALGYAGHDPMRLRVWPTEAQMARLFDNVTVDAGRFIAEAAGDLTLGEMIDLLGRRAEQLSEVWNAWGRIRPLLLGQA
jgi:hypothetical protein